MKMFDPIVEYREIFNENEQLIIQNEFKRLKGLCYLDHTGCPAYSDSQVSSVFNDLRNNVFGNPHSGSTTSKYCIDFVDQMRYKILQHFNTSANEYSVIFTSGATAALKLVAESFMWLNKYDNEEDISSEKSVFMYMEDNHTSVLGMRNVISQKNVETICLSHADTISAFDSSSSVDSSTCASNSLFVYSAQCNFSGVKYPLSWVNKVHDGALTAVTGSKSNWYCLLDAATYVSSNQLNLSSVNPDFVAISFYKMFGFPTGLGALLVKNSVSHLLEKTYYGGGTVLVAMSEKNMFVPRPVLHERFEDGTINFLSIISLDHGFKVYEKIVNLDKISKHCFDLARYAFHCLLRLHHANGNPLAIIYADTDYSDILTQGNILNFNLLRSDGEYIGYAEVMNLANLHGIQLRTGCFCNPGACRRHLNLTSEEVMKHFEAGHVCGDDNDLIAGKPTGSIRVSFGHYTTIDDVTKFLEFIETCFVMKPTIKKYPINWRKSPGLEAENNTYLPGSLISKSSLDNKLAAINLIYFWLENFDGICNYNYPAENKISTQAKTNGDNKMLKNPTLSHLFLYPIKSCGRFSVSQWELSSTGLRYDREWMITTASGIVLTQKSDPRLCLIRPSIDLKEKKLILSYKGYPNFSIRIEDEESEVTEAWMCSSKVCGDSVRGLDCGDSVSLWLSHVLGKEGLRLIRQRERDTKSGGALSFSNQAQYLLINKASVNWLSEKLVEMPSSKRNNLLDRFRSNFVVEGLSVPFEEQRWTEVALGSHDFKVCGPCMRCQMICIDQDTGEKTKEPLTTLAASMKGKLKFGIYLSNDCSSQVVLSVGDVVSFKTDPS